MNSLDFNPLFNQLKRTIIVLMLINSCCCSISASTEKLIINPPKDIKGGKCYKTRVYEAKSEFDKIIPGSYVWSFQDDYEQIDRYHDVQGRIVYSIKYLINKESDKEKLEPYRTVEYIYYDSKSQKLLEKVERSVDLNNAIVTVLVTKFERHVNGNLLKRFVFQNDTLIEKTVCENDSNGNVIFNSVYDKTGLSYTESREYDSMDSLLVYKREKPTYPKLLSYHRFTYDPLHRKILEEYKSMFDNGDLANEGVKSDFLYDSKGRVISYIDSYRISDPFTSGAFSTGKEKYVYEYDNHGNIIHHRREDADSGFARSMFIHSYEYDYNTQGEWVKRMEFDNHKQPLYISIREIEIIK